MASWETLLPVIVGGVIGVAGGLAGPPLTHWLNKGAERERTLAGKLEEMILLVHDHHHWVGVMMRHYSSGKVGEPISASPLPRAQAVASMYFPQFAENLSFVDVYASEFLMWAMEQGYNRPDKQAGAVTKTLGEAYKPYLKAYSETTKALQDFATQNFSKP